MVSLSVLLVLLIIATWTDYKDRKIKNWNTYPGIFIAFLLNFSGQGILPVGWEGFTESLIGFLVCGLIMVFSYVLFNVGGGDVKLLAMIGAFLGVQHGVLALLWTFSVGFVIAIAMIIWQIGIARIICKSFAHLWLVLKSRSWVPLAEAERAPLKVSLFLAPSALIAVVIVQYPFFRVYLRGAQAFNS